MHKTFIPPSVRTVITDPILRKSTTDIYHHKNEVEKEIKMLSNLEHNKYLNAPVTLPTVFKLYHKIEARKKLDPTDYQFKQSLKQQK